MAKAPAAAPSETELRELVVRADMLRQQLGALEAQREMLVEVTEDTSRALLTLGALAQAKEGDEVLVPIGAGAFVPARLTGSGKAIAALGSALHAELPIADAEARLRERVQGLQATSQRLTTEISRLVEEMTALNATLESHAG